MTTDKRRFGRRARAGFLCAALAMSGFAFGATQVFANSYSAKPAYKLDREKAEVAARAQAAAASPSTPVTGPAASAGGCPTTPGTNTVEPYDGFGPFGGSPAFTTVATITDLAGATYHVYAGASTADPQQGTIHVIPYNDACGRGTDGPAADYLDPLKLGPVTMTKVNVAPTGAAIEFTRSGGIPGLFILNSRQFV
jgi:hypothetical protein